MRRVGSPIYSNGIISGNYLNYYIANIGYNLATVRYTTVSFWYAVNGQLTNNTGGADVRHWPLLGQTTNNGGFDGYTSFITSYPYQPSNMFLGVSCRGLNGPEFFNGGYVSGPTSVWTKSWNCVVAFTAATSNPSTGPARLRIHHNYVNYQGVGDGQHTVGSTGLNPELRILSDNTGGIFTPAPLMLLSDIRVYHRLISTQEIQQILSDVPPQVLDHASRNGFTIKTKMSGSL